ncbi:NADH-quinone oxidoreductase subunit N [Dongshaea marina]|uniref:NADH-quinone oxidoreductase subunit N n=1 Tax=Dongshaea marina TaxID=2047966 RepID=UPI000D3EC5F5|nr:NADH-quinone oxidoreductase subunit N [Dongshaea marina]
MTFADLYTLLPIILTGIGGLVVLLLGVWPGVNNAKPAFYGSVVILLATIFYLMVTNNQASEIEQFISIGPVTHNMWLLFSCGGLATILLAQNYKPLEGEIDEIFYSLVMFCVTGTLILSASVNLLAAFLGMELTTLSVLALIAWQPNRKGAIEASIKFALTATLAAVIMLFGIVLIYAGSGTVYLPAIIDSLQQPHALPLLVKIGLGLMIAGIAFDLAIAPFHCWLADVFHGAPAPVMGFIGSIGKIAMLMFLLHLGIAMSEIWQQFAPLLWGMVILSIVLGNLLALRQSNLKRMLAYSSVAHFGYILMAIALIAPTQANHSLVFNGQVLLSASYYGLCYAVMNMVCFAVIALLAQTNPSGDIQGYRGLGRRYPLAGVALAIAMVSLAGFPPTAGFFAKLFVFTQVLAEHHWLITLIAALGAATSVFYYLRVLVIFFSAAPEAASTPRQEGALVVSFGPSAVIVVSAIATIGFGIFANTILNQLI